MSISRAPEFRSSSTSSTSIRVPHQLQCHRKAQRIFFTSIDHSYISISRAPEIRSSSTSSTSVCTPKKFSTVRQRRISNDHSQIPPSLRSTIEELQRDTPIFIINSSSIAHPSRLRVCTKDSTNPSLIRSNMKQLWLQVVATWTPPPHTRYCCRHCTRYSGLVPDLRVVQRLGTPVMALTSCM